MKLVKGGWSLFHPHEKKMQSLTIAAQVNLI